MNILIQVVIYCLIALAGIVISAVSPIPLPASILSMVLLFLLLLFRVLQKERIREVSTFLIQIMGLFFVTPVVSMVAEASKVGKELLPIALISIIAMLITFTVSAFAIRLTLRLMKGRSS